MEENTATTRFHGKLYTVLNSFVHAVYDATGNFPREELFGVTSQLRRAALSVILKYIEGYARQQRAENKHFLEISYGSLKEAAYLIAFSNERRFLAGQASARLLSLADEAGAMLRTTIQSMKEDIQRSARKRAS